MGCRVRIGQRQWLVYRSLGPAGNRTLLGHNLIGSFLLGQFLPTGEVHTILELE